MVTPKYRSGLERRVVADLERRGIEFEYEPSPLPYFTKVRMGVCPSCGSPNVYQHHWYTPDLVFPNGVYVEIKGKFTGTMRTKMLAVKKNNPDSDIRMLFQSDNWISKKKASRYSDWCEKNGFTYHIGEEVPESWVQ